MRFVIVGLLVHFAMIFYLPYYAESCRHGGLERVEKGGELFWVGGDGVVIFCPSINEKIELFFGEDGLTKRGTFSAWGYGLGGFSIETISSPSVEEESLYRSFFPDEAPSFWET